jgi:hypothetical protein
MREINEKKLTLEKIFLTIQSYIFRSSKRIKRFEQIFAAEKFSKNPLDPLNPLTKIKIE